MKVNVIKSLNYVDIFNRIKYAVILLIAMLLLSLQFWSVVIGVNFNKYMLTDNVVVKHNGIKVFEGDVDNYKFKGVKSEDRLTMYMTIPDVHIDKPGIMYDNINTAVNIYLNGKKVYSIGENVKKGGVVCHAYNKVPLEELNNIKGTKRLIMEMRVMNESTLIRLPQVKLMEMDDIDKEYFTGMNIYIFMGVYLLIIGIIGVFITCLIWRKEIIYGKILVISIWSINCALYILSTFQVIPVFSDNLVMEAYIEYITKLLLIVIINIYMLLEKKGNERITSILLVAISSIYTIVVVVLQVKHIAYINDTNEFYFLLMALTGIDFIIYYLNNMKESKSKNTFIGVSSVIVVLLCLYGTVHIFFTNMTNYFVILIPIALITMITLVFTNLVLTITSSMIDDAGKDALKKLAFIDKFTGLYNRRGLRNYINNTIDKNMVYDLLLIDLNGLKKVNDTYGHDAGDDLIKSFSIELHKSFEEGFVARIGGDEFVALIKSNEESQLQVAELRKNVAVINEESDKEYKMGYAIGVATFSPKKVSFNDALKEADQKMYEMKKKQKSKA